MVGARQEVRRETTTGTASGSPAGGARCAGSTPEGAHNRARRRVILLAGGAAALGSAASAGACGAPGSRPETGGGPSAAPYKVVSGNKFDAGERLSWAQETAAEFSRLHGPQLTAEHVVISGTPSSPPWPPARGRT
jgi:hypothetical protein